MNKEVSIIIVSGRSGSGKTAALNILEDFGYYVIDNLPLSLINNAVDELIGDNIKKVALGVDVRTAKADLSTFPNVYNDLINKYQQSVKVLYVTAQLGILVSRFAATRRVHPLMSMVNDLSDALIKTHF